MIFAKAFLCGRGLNHEETRLALGSANPGALVQTVKSTASRNERFIEMIAAQTLQAASSGSLLAKRQEIDFMLRLAGTTQISRAIKGQGVKGDAPFLVVVASRTPVKGTRDLEKTELPRRELSAADLIRVEKAALLNAKRA
jgi:tRNA threonylcarbamoyladenosine modification (KEOPS) complex Cgi121 subunit